MQHVSTISFNGTIEYHVVTRYTTLRVMDSVMAGDTGNTRILLTMLRQQNLQRIVQDR